jgi:hypothetical protein
MLMRMFDCAKRGDDFSVNGCTGSSSAAQVGMCSLKEYGVISVNEDAVIRGETGEQSVAG